MAISKKYFEDFVNENIALFSLQRINKIIQVTKFDYYFFLIPSKKVLHVSFNGNSPFICLENEFQFTKLTTSSSIQQIKKHLNDAKITSISLLNDDKIICFNFKKTYDNYEVLEGKLILEFITNHSNLIILDNSDKIIYALHYTPVNIARIIAQNVKYEFPFKGEKSTFTEAKTDDLNKINQYNESILNQIKKDQFDKVIKKVNSSIKSLTKRIGVLKDLQLNSSRFEDYKEAGDYIYYHLDEEFSSFEINEKIFELNPLLSKVENANYFYKKYKKLKEGNKINAEFLTKAENELLYFNNLKYQINNASIDDMEEISEELQEKGLIKPDYSTKKKIKSVMPYYVVYNDTKIYFGKNNMQNEVLTFSLAKKDYYYLHVKDYHGAHVVIFSNNPAKEVIQKACEIALFLSNLQSGEIYLADVKDVKKGEVRGLTYLTKFSTIYLPEFDWNSTKKLLENYQR